MGPFVSNAHPSHGRVGIVPPTSRRLTGINDGGFSNILQRPAFVDHSLIFSSVLSSSFQVWYLYYITLLIQASKPNVHHHHQQHPTNTQQCNSPPSSLSPSPASLPPAHHQTAAKPKPKNWPRSVPSAKPTQRSAFPSLKRCLPAVLNAWPMRRAPLAATRWISPVSAPPRTMLR